MTIGTNQGFRERWVDVETVAAFLSVTPYWVRKMAVRGEIPGSKFGRYWRFRLSDVDAAMKQRAELPRKRR